MYKTGPFEFNFIDIPIIKNSGNNNIIKKKENKKSTNLFKFI